MTLTNCYLCSISTSCNECTAGNYLYESSSSIFECVNPCPTGTWLNSVNAKCVPCTDNLDNCTSCSNSTSCETCKTNFYLNEDSTDIFLCVAACPLGINFFVFLYLKGSWTNTINKKCVFCNESLNNCEECDSDSNCTNCETNYNFIVNNGNFICVDTCPTSFNNFKKF